jgi:hypothetical protein
MLDDAIHVPMPIATLGAGLASLALACITLMQAWATAFGRWPGDPARFHANFRHQTFTSGLLLPFLEAWIRLTAAHPWLDPDHLSLQEHLVRDIGLGAAVTLGLDPANVSRIRYGLRETRLGRDPAPYLVITARDRTLVLRRLQDHAAPADAVAALGRRLQSHKVRLSPVWNRTSMYREDVGVTLRVDFRALSSHHRLRAMETYRDLVGS